MFERASHQLFVIYSFTLIPHSTTSIQHLRVKQSPELFVFLVGERMVGSIDPLLVEFLDLVVVHVQLHGLEGKCLNQVKVGVTNKGPEQPEEGLFVLVV